MCLALKLLQLQPEREIILEYLRAEEFKSVPKTRCPYSCSTTRLGLASDPTHFCAYRYLRALAAFYVRLTFDPVNVYEILEPLLDDYRKIRTRSMGEYGLKYFMGAQVMRLVEVLCWITSKAVDCHSLRH